MWPRTRVFVCTNTESELTPPTEHMHRVKSQVTKCSMFCGIPWSSIYFTSWPFYMLLPLHTFLSPSFSPLPWRADLLLTPQLTHHWFSKATLDHPPWEPIALCSYSNWSRYHTAFWLWIALILWANTIWAPKTWKWLFSFLDREDIMMSKGEHGCELCGSIYTRFFFPINTVALHIRGFSIFGINQPQIQNSIFAFPTSDSQPWEFRCQATKQANIIQTKRDKNEGPL